MSPTLKERGLHRVCKSGVGISGSISAFCSSYLAKNDKNPPTSPYWSSRSGVKFLILQRGKIRLWGVKRFGYSHRVNTQEVQVRPLGWEDPLEEGMAIHLYSLPEKSHGPSSLVGYGPKGGKESDTTERLKHKQRVQKQLNRNMTSKFLTVLFSKTNGKNSSKCKHSWK